jgi:uncharacterized membrane protein YedE/YeeE
MASFTPLSSLLGGALIGGAASLLFVLNGRIAGVSGILGGLIVPSGDDKAPRLAFVVALLAAGAAIGALVPAAFGAGPAAPLPLLAAAGVAIGAGTRAANGCTSGHGVAGLSRLSLRSLVAVATFMAVAGLTVFAVRRLAGQP